MAFEVDTIDLTMADSDTGMYLTGNVYYVDGVTDEFGNNRPLSIGQLVMAICLQRASDLEYKIVQMMNKMSITSEELSALTTIEEDAFQYIAAESVQIPACVTEISGNPFAGSSVRYIYGFTDLVRTFAGSNGYIFVPVRE